MNLWIKDQALISILCRSADWFNLSPISRDCSNLKMDIEILKFISAHIGYQDQKFKDNNFHKKVPIFILINQRIISLILKYILINQRIISLILKYFLINQRIISLILKYILINQRIISFIQIYILINQRIISLILKYIPKFCNKWTWANMKVFKKKG